MKHNAKTYAALVGFQAPDTILVIQAPLPLFFDTLPKLSTTKRRGSGRQGPSPSAPPGRLRHA